MRKVWIFCLFAVFWWANLIVLDYMYAGLDWGYQRVLDLSLYLADDEARRGWDRLTGIVMLMVCPPLIVLVIYTMIRDWWDDRWSHRRWKTYAKKDQTTQDPRV